MFLCQINFAVLATIQGRSIFTAVDSVLPILSLNVLSEIFLFVH